MRKKIKALLDKIKKIKLKKPTFSKIKTNHIFWRKLIWVVAALVVIYILTGTGFSVAIYKYHKSAKASQVVSRIYPLPAAWVGFQPIWVKDVFKQQQYINNFSKQSDQAIAQGQELRTQIIEQLTQLALVKKQAKKYKIKVTKKDVDDAYNKIAEQSGGADQLKKVLTEMYGMKDADFRKLVSDQLYVEKMQQDVFVQIKAQHILIKDEAKAKDILTKVKAGEDFSTLAKDNSEDTGSKDNGGELGWFTRGSMVKEFEDAAFALKSGEIAQDLVKTEYGYHIIKVEDKKGQIDQSFDNWFTEIKSKTKIRNWLK